MFKKKSTSSAAVAQTSRLPLRVAARFQRAGADGFQPSASWLPQCRRQSALFALLLLCGLTACTSIPPLPPVNLADAGWTVRRGQAVWHSKPGGPEIAGELLLATDAQGRAFIQFANGPFPLVVAQSATNAWQLELPAQTRRYSGRGAPPDRLIWLQLPRAIAGAPPHGWSWQIATNDWRLENRATGEWLAGYFTP